MIYDDIDLIQQTLEGNQQAFTALVERYQKQIHALAWQKIDDFHIAQEITQDVFLTAYQKLTTLKDHNRFSGWLYVIANRKCIAWHRKKSRQPQSLEMTNPIEIEKVAYSEYMTQEREEAANKNKRAVVKKLLSKLQESDRTIVNLYYIAEMTCEDIGKFLGVSPNKVRSRLHRARNRLKKEEAIIQENLSSFQIPTQLTENIMKEISRLNPVAPSGNKPLVPLAVSAASAIIVLFLIGIGAQNLIQFQKPYSLEATSKPTIEIVETQLVLQSPTEPAIRNQVGHSDVTGQSDRSGQKLDALSFAETESDEVEITKSNQQWVQTNGPDGGTVATLFTTTRGDVYAGTLSGLYRLRDDREAWKLVNTIKDSSYTVQNSGATWLPVAEWKNTLYLATSKEILSSTDRGETWKVFCECIGGQLVGMVITDGIPGAQSDMMIYLASTNGVFRTDNAGKSWTLLYEGLPNRSIHSINVIKNTIFAGTDQGLYRFNSDTWEQLTIDQKDTRDKTGVISALAVAENHLYVATKKAEKNNSAGTIRQSVGYVLKDNQPFSWFLYRSDDQGYSWNSITPRQSIPEKKPPMKSQFEITFSHSSKSNNPQISEIKSTFKIIASGKKIMVIDGNKQFYSYDTGETWTSLSDAGGIGNATAAVLLDADTFYRSGPHGIHRTTDRGKSWQELNIGLVNTSVIHLISINSTLYANRGMELVSSTDGGESWLLVSRDTSNFSDIIEFDGTIYARDIKNIVPRLFRFSTEDSRFIRIIDMPDVEKGDLIGEWINQIAAKIMLETVSDEDLKQGTTIDSDKNDFNKSIEKMNLMVHQEGAIFIQSLLGSFAVSDTAYYMEYKRKLLRWKPNTSNWYDTGLADQGERYKDFDHNFDDTVFKLAVSRNTVYVGKRNGQLFQSFDEGDTWNNVTTNLPFSFNYFKAIDFAGKNIYVATDNGVVWSINGTDWNTLTDADGVHLVMDRFAVDGTTIYGQTGEKVYQLVENSNIWKQVTPEIPYSILSFDVDANILYVGTIARGVLRFTLTDQADQ